MSEQRSWQEWLRRDVSEVTPLGSYAAKRCPVRTQLDVLRPVERADVSDFLASLGARGVEFEEEVLGDLTLEFDLVTVDLTDRQAAEQATLEQMAAGAPVVANGRLPVDPEGRRVGEPDLLVRVGDAPVDGRWRYAPVDVKSHGMLRPDRGNDVVVQPLADLHVPGPDAATSPDGRRDGTARGDALQLAHYHRMLQACGHADDDTPWGAIVGAEGWAVWMRLDEPVWKTPTADEDLSFKLRSSLEVYDFEFAFRLDIAAAAMAHQGDPSLPLLVEPVLCGECPECPWREHCLPDLEARDDVSLLPKVSFEQWRALREAGLDTIAEVADADVGPVEGLSDRAAAELRLQARARTEGDPFLPRGPVTNPPRADVEVDVDMENVDAHAYLWGATVTVRREGLGVEPGHRSFATWSPPGDQDALADNFRAFWTWLTDLRDHTVEAGGTFTAYCWSAAAENRHLRLGGAATGLSEPVEEFIASDHWCDLLAWFRGHWATGRGNGLKTVAHHLGFEWRDDDPGGAASMTWFSQAIGDDPDTAEAARRRLIAYNEDDCRATVAVRTTLSE